MDYCRKWAWSVGVASPVRGCLHSWLRESHARAACDWSSWRRACSACSLRAGRCETPPAPPESRRSEWSRECWPRTLAAAGTPPHPEAGPAQTTRPLHTPHSSSPTPPAGGSPTPPAGSSPTPPAGSSTHCIYLDVSLELVVVGIDGVFSLLLVLQQ